ncbi:unnamed protein product [Oppiella nova]|uniref:Uncharacterized protein n=1 Tax=Oppiella nova TaxID=334625 RepID=A0A7R9LWB9_9ACAR|nr:unnamed protein product [Oppiella nova]CAG2167637.1 unnamed protein product [Oppiella nova]
MQQIFDNKNFIPIAIVACIIVVALHVVGMIGAYLEHYGLSISYAVLLTLSTIILIISCFRDKFNIIWLDQDYNGDRFIWKAQTQLPV